MECFVLRQGAVGTLWRLDRDRGNSGCLMPADGGGRLQEVVELCGGVVGWSSADEMQFSGGMLKGGPSRIVQRARLSS